MELLINLQILAFGVNATGSGITFQVLSDILVQGTRTSLDGRGGVFLMTSNADGQFVKTNFALRSFCDFY